MIQVALERDLPKIISDLGDSLFKEFSKKLEDKIFKKIESQLKDQFLKQILDEINNSVPEIEVKSKEESSKEKKKK